MKSKNARDTLCEAALRIANRDGLLAMTLDNVAKEAQVSKGGLMYHFPTKDDLIRAMLEYFGDDAEQLLIRKMAEDPGARFRFARSFLSSVFGDGEEDRDAPEHLKREALERMMLAMIAAVANNPNVIEPLRGKVAKIRDRVLSDRRDGMEQLLIWLAVDGLMLWQFLGLIDREDPLFAEVGAALRKKTEPKKRKAKRPTKGGVA
ncbi:MAG: TetR/AcrR family transcriptional regulator [Gemmataceae bacterium]